MSILKKIIEDLGMTPYSFAKSLGYDRVDKIYNTLNGKTKISPSVISDIIRVYPSIDTSLFFENNYKENSDLEIVREPEAEIIKSPKSKTQKAKHDGLLVPFYNIDFSAGNDLVLVDNNKVAPDYYMDVPEFSGCTAFKAYSDSMEKLIKSGNILFGTKVEEWQSHLEYGQIYGIICDDGRRYLKYIRKFNENSREYFLLKSENDNYDDFEIPKNAIRSIWLIHGWLNKRT